MPMSTTNGPDFDWFLFRHDGTSLEITTVEESSTIATPVSYIVISEN